MIPKALLNMGILGLILTTGGAYCVSTTKEDYLGTSFGYFLFLIDFFLIFMIFKMITLGTNQNEKDKRSSIGLLIGLIAGKLLGLVFAVYVGLVVWQLTISYVFVGMLISMVLIGVWISITFLSKKSGLE